MPRNEAVAERLADAVPSGTETHFRKESLAIVLSSKRRGMLALRLFLRSGLEHVSMVRRKANR